jgi:pyrimidine operon attenuation protein / uracil phosphoribosyltransferase
MDHDRLSRTLTRMAHEIVERHPDMAGVALVGVRSRGVPLAKRIAECLKEASGVTPKVGALDITLYRDDLTAVATHPVLKATDIPFPIEKCTVILVDDVLYTGRTVRAALDELIDFGRPARIELAVLVDRGHRELPIRADYVGKSLTTSREEIVQVLLQEEDGVDRVLLLERDGKAGNGAKAKPAKADKPAQGRPRPKARRR